MNTTIKVPPTGPLNAKIAFVGEAPGSDEVAQGIPFVGRAGSLFDRLLGMCGINRKDCYITNVIKEQPPKTGKKSNDVSVFVDLSKKFPIETAEFQKYKAELKEELSHCSANLIVALGNTPLYALTNQNGITKRRGSIYASTLLPGRKVLAVLHPAACLYGGDAGGNFDYQNFILFDLHRARTESEYPDIRLPRRNVLLQPSFDEAMDWFDICFKRDIVSFDIECINLELDCFALAIDQSNTMCIPFRKSQAPYWNPEKEDRIMIRLSELLTNPKIKKLGQNIIFDFSFMFRRYGISIQNIEDTMIAQGLLYPDYPKGLDFITSIYGGGEPYYKDDGKNYYKYGGDELSFQRYNGMDTLVLFDAHQQQLQELERGGNLPTYRRLCRLIEPLVFMSEKGIRVDKEGLTNASAVTAKQIDILKRQIQIEAAANGMPDLNPDSPKQLMTYFYEVKKLENGRPEKAYKSRKTGNPTTDEDALKRLSRKGHIEASMLLKIRSLSKLRGTYLDVKLGEDDRFRASFNPVGTVSGRLSSSKNIFGEGSNSQNLPRDDYEFELDEND